MFSSSNKVLYLLGQFISQIGSNLFLIAMIIWLKRSDYSQSYISYFLMASSLAGLFFSPFSGVWTDRLGSKKMMVLTDLLNGLLMLSISYFMYAKFHNAIYFILVFTFLSSIMNSFFAPASLSILGSIVTKDEIKHLSSWSSNIIESSKILGRASGGLLVIYISPELIIFINGLSFLLSSLLEAKIIIIENNKNHKRQSYWVEFSKGFEYLKNKKELLYLFIGAGITNFFFAINTPLLPRIIDDFMGIHLSWYGIIMSGYGLGAVLGGYIARKIPNSRIFFKYALIVQSFPLLFIPFTQSVMVLLCLLIFLGFFYVFIQVNIITFITKITDGLMRGRVFSLMFSVVGIFMPLSYFILSFFPENSFMPIKIMYLLGGIIIPLTWAVFISKVSIQNIS